MTTFDLPPIPAELMDDQPIEAEDFDAATTILGRAGVEFGDVLPDGESVMPPAFGRFQVTDERSAEWALRKVADQQARRADVREQAAGWREEIDRWEREQCKAPSSFESFLVGHLEAYMRARVEADPKLRTVSLPSGKLKATSAKAKVGLADTPDRLAELVAWADENLEGDELAAVVKTTRTPMVSALAKIATPSVEELGYRYSFDLACGHSFEQFVPVDHPECFEPFTTGDTLACSACEPAFGEPPQVEVETVAVVTVEEPVVRSTALGYVIPGAVVVPPSMSYSVKVGG